MHFTRFALLASTVVIAFTSAQSVPPSEEVLVFNPNSTTIWKAGTPVTVNWKFLLADGPFTNLGFDISLYKGNFAANTTALVRELGRSGRGGSSYAFDLPASIVNGSDYQIRVGPYSTESFVILGVAGPTPTAPTSSGSPGNIPTRSRGTSSPTKSKSAEGAASGLAVTPLALAGSTLAMFVVALAL
ncbi:hypothetical protein BGZ96_003735 [Linnemannia gamsii]|uniref:Yeast cell wall synthesis Kre9/Knh1-like N-terminal domain-containing protein n=1 Tax=Linnemannia gamsii TaxID=64522 RepID=A0ABQ7K8D1_9FUNG|nr:hypothetical protein BGZ96_003735 [Linnemannia gamsii]